MNGAAPITVTYRHLAFALALALALALLACTPEPLPHDHDGPPELAEQIQRMQIRTMLRLMPDPADLRPLARAYINRMTYTGDVELPDLSTRMFTAPPATIKIWQRSKGGSKSCDGPVITLKMEDYVKGVLPHEWISSWNQESLRAGAVAIRSYASAWVNAGGKYDCADLCDTTYSQVYKPTTLPVTNQAVDHTKQQVMLKGGKIPSTEYSAENSSYPKWEGTTVDDTATCAGKTLFGHGRGMCQWGSQRWALKGKSYTWIVAHYYPGATLWKPSVPAPDKGPPPKLDRGPPPPDRSPPPKLDRGALPPDRSPPPKRDSGAFTGDMPTSSIMAYNTLNGGCNLGPSNRQTPLPAPLWLLVLLLVAWRYRGQER